MLRLGHFVRAHSAVGSSLKALLCYRRADMFCVHFSCLPSLAHGHTTEKLVAANTTLIIVTRGLLACVLMLQMYPHGVLEPGGMKNHVGDSDMHMEFVHGSSPARHKLCARVQWASKQHVAAALCSAHTRVSSSAVGDQRELRRHSKLVHLWGSAGVSSWRAHGACRWPHTRAAPQCHARRSPGRGLSQAAPTFT